MNINILIGKKFKLKGSNGKFKQYEIFDIEYLDYDSIIFAKDKKNQGVELSLIDFLNWYKENKIQWI
jgi:hypothetical protein